MKNGKGWFIALTIATLLAGAFLGIILDRGVLSHRCGPPPGMRHGWHGRDGAKKDFVERLTKDLSLSSDQEKQLVGILNKNEPEILRLRIQMRKTFMQFHQKVSMEIMGILDDDQKPKFKKICDMQQRSMLRNHDRDRDERR